jgi:hypothetical protein
VDPHLEIGGDESAAVDDATHLTFDAIGGESLQNVLTIEGVIYTASFDAKNISGNTDLQIRHGGSATGTRTPVTLTGSLASYSVSVLGKVGGGNVSFGIEDLNAAGHGQIEILNWSVTPRTSAPTNIEVTDDKQEVWDWSGNTNHAQRGSAAGSDTNDFAYNTWSRNLLAPGSTEDLESASWTHTATTDDADNLTFTAQNDLISQDVTTVAGVTYTLSAKIRAVTGNTALHFYHNNSATGNSTAQAVTATLTRYEVSVLGRAGGGAVSFGIQDQNAAGHGQIEIEEWQVEVASATTTYTNPAERREIVADFDGVDNYVNADAVGSVFSGADVDMTVIVVAKHDSPGVNSDFFSFGRSSTGEPYIVFSHNASHELRITQRDDASVGAVATSTEVLTGSTWYLLSMVLDSGTLAAYINGTPATLDVTDFTALGQTTLDRATIGALGRATYSEEFNGTIALVAVYSRALSAAEITTVYNVIKTAWNYDGDNERGLTLP